MQELAICTTLCRDPGDASASVRTLRYENPGRRDDADRLRMPELTAAQDKTPDSHGDEKSLHSAGRDPVLLRALLVSRLVLQCDETRLDVHPL